VQHLLPYMCCWCIPDTQAAARTVRLGCPYPTIMPVGTIWDIKVEVVATRTGNFVSTATVTAPNDSNPANNRDTAITTVVAAGTCGTAFVCNPGTVPNRAAAISTDLSADLLPGNLQQYCCEQQYTCSICVLTIPTLLRAASAPPLMSSPAAPHSWCPYLPATPCLALCLPYHTVPAHRTPFYNPNTSSVTPPTGPSCCTRSCSNIGATNPPVNFSSQCAPPFPGTTRLQAGTRGKWGAWT